MTARSRFFLLGPLLIGVCFTLGLTQVGQVARADQSEPAEPAVPSVPGPELQPAASSLAWNLIGAPAGAPLSGAKLDRITEEIASLMRCPVCQGLSVADSPTTSALAMREEARDLLALGYTGDQVLAYFERSYGEFIRLSPKPVGFNLVVWILPVVALLAGALLIAGRIRRRARIGAGSTGSDGAGSGDGTKAAVLAVTGAPASDIPDIPEDLAAYAERVRREVNE